MANQYVTMSEFTQIMANSFKKGRIFDKDPNRVPVSQDEINEESERFTRELIAKRPKEYTFDDLVKIADEYDPVEHFKHECDEIIKKYKNKED